MGAQYVLEQVIGLQGMINYVDARTSWMDDIVKQAQWQGIRQVRPSLYSSHQMQASTTAVGKSRSGLPTGYHTLSIRHAVTIRSSMILQVSGLMETSQSPLLMPSCTCALVLHRWWSLQLDIAPGPIASSRAPPKCVLPDTQNIAGCTLGSMLRLKSRGWETARPVMPCAILLELSSHGCT